MKIMTVGSCLSVGVANSLKEMGSYTRVSSVQHNRIDQFVDTLILKTLTQTTLKNNELILKSEYEHTNVIQNQVEDWGLGKSLPEKGDTLLHPSKVILEGQVDLLIIDTFPDLYFKTYYAEDKKSRLFLNEVYFENIPDNYVFDTQLMPIQEIIKNYDLLMNFVTSNNPNVKCIIINFPVNLNPKEVLRGRAMELSNSTLSLINKHENLFCIPLQGIYKSDLKNRNDIHHFTGKKYSEFALTVEGIISACKNNTEFLTLYNKRYQKLDR